jgi:GDP/UDP-N,N'-diacetylbacillosamine 2-epimerase (hydrolysing)
MRKICVVTGSRAEYGLLRLVMEGIRNSPKLDLQVLATGMHLSQEFGLTYREIEKDGFRIDRKVEMLLSSDTSVGIAKSMGLGMIGFADSLNDLKPDLLLVLGDRYEIFAASSSAMIANIPIMHIHGGETTAGAFDEAIRHSITKMAWWHFVAADEYRKRVIQLGENPNRVFEVGGMGVDAIKKTKLLTKNYLIDKIGIKFSRNNFLITYHAATLEQNNSQKHLQELLDVLDELENMYLIFTMPNADTDCRIIKNMILDYVNNHPNNSISFTSMGSLIYLSTLQFIDGVIGNSSSGLTEAPTFKIGTINIGDRQKGRLKAESVIDCEPTNKSIKQAIKKLYSKSFRKVLNSVKNPYGEGDATEKIMRFLTNEPLPKDIKKDFYDL